MKRLPHSTHALTFENLVHNDRHHDRFLHRDIATLRDDEIWAEQKLLEGCLASLIWHRDQSVIFGSDLLTGTPHPMTRRAWIRARLRALHTEERRRLQGRAA